LAFRVWDWYAYVRPEHLPAIHVRQAFITGFRFDLKIASFLAIPVLLCELILLGMKNFPKPQKYIHKLVSIWGAGVILATVLLGLINHFYIGYYQSPINVIIFGLFDYDTFAVLTSVWQDFPIVKLLLAVSILSWTVYAIWNFFSKRLGIQIAQRSRFVSVIFCCATVLLFAGFARGSLGKFPLRQSEVSATPFEQINQIVPNGPWALRTAISDRSNDQIDKDPATGLRALGFPTPAAAAKAYGLTQTEDHEILNALYQRTPLHAELAQAPPNVVFAQMESWGRYAMEFDSPSNDLLGRLRAHASKDYLFKNLLSAQNGTGATFEALAFNSPVTPLALGRNGLTQLQTSAVLPYKNAGYHVIFLTSGKRSWRSVNRVLPKQGFDEVLDMNDIMTVYPEAAKEIGAWGIPDAYMFQYANILLKKAEATGKPLLIYINTQTNHPPYVVPKSYPIKPLNLAAFGNKLNEDTKTGLSILQTYQYSNDALGGFMDTLYKDGLAEKTLVAATGDHYTRNLFKFTGDAHMQHTYGVPLYLHIPQSLRPTHVVDLEKYASHRDIFTTLYNHSLSDACYFSAGQNLLSPNAENVGVALSEYRHMISPDGAVQDITRPQYLRWTADGKAFEPYPENTVPERMKAQVLREKAYVALLDWNIRSELLQPSTSMRCEKSVH
ncbi:MAG: LTA synthase family protein, partial [Pseudomonadota bacterium]